MQPIPRRRGTRSRRAVGRSVAEVHNRRWIAESILLLEDGLLVRNGQVCARRVFESTKVTNLIARATAESKVGAAAGRMLVGRCDGLRAYVLTVAPLRVDLAVDDRRFAVIVVVDPERHSPSTEDLAEFFGLSPAEARLAAALLTGKTLSDIAANSGVRITTLRTQLGSILRKVGAKRQCDLVRILSSTGIGSVSLSAWWLDVAVAAAQLPLSLAAI